jgi:hypothetical protein
MAETRRTIAEKVIELTHKIADDVPRIEEGKEKLRAIATEANEGFVETFGQMGEIQVSAPSERKFKGIVPELNAEAYLDLAESRRKKLEEDGVVTMTREYTKGAKPSVTVRM